MKPNKFAQPLKLPLLAAALLGLAGCQQDKDDLNAYVARVQAQHQSDIPPVPTMSPYQKFSYAAAELRDPFVPTVVDVPAEEETPILAEGGVQPDMSRRKEALENFDLGDLQFTGTIEQDKVWALIRSPDGIIHRVQTGNYLGTNHGKIIAISDTALKLNEIVPEGRGGYVERETSLSVIEVR